MSLQGWAKTGSEIRLRDGRHSHPDPSSRVLHQTRLCWRTTTSPGLLRPERWQQRFQSPRVRSALTTPQDQGWWEIRHFTPTQPQETDQPSPSYTHTHTAGCWNFPCRKRTKLSSACPDQMSITPLSLALHKNGNRIGNRIALVNLADTAKNKICYNHEKDSMTAC